MWPKSYAENYRWTISCAIAEKGRAYPARQEVLVYSRLQLPRDIIIAPARAIARIIETKEWVASYIVVAILGLVATVLVAPALAHVVVTALAAQPGPKVQSPAAAVQATLWAQGAAQLYMPLVAWSFSAFVMWMASMEHPQKVLSALLSLNAVTAIPSAIGSLALAAAIYAHDPTTYKTLGDLFLALPDSLASLRPHGTDRELAFLSYWNIFQVWSLVLAGYGFAAIAKTGLTRSLFLSFGIGLSLALFGALLT